MSSANAYILASASLQKILWLEVLYP